MSFLLVDHGGSGHGVVVVGKLVLGGGASSSACSLLFVVGILRSNT